MSQFMAKQQASPFGLRCVCTGPEHYILTVRERLCMERLGCLIRLGSSVNSNLPELLPETRLEKRPDSRRERLTGPFQ
jgi:hypothetical protein